MSVGQNKSHVTAVVTPVTCTQVDNSRYEVPPLAVMFVPKSSPCLFLTQINWPFLAANETRETKML